MNTQHKSKQNLSCDGVKAYLEINSIFETIQGEGPYSGTPATFIRLSGCNLRCYWCDTDYSNTESTTVLRILQEVITYKPRLVVITGGEPFRQNIVPLINALLDAGFLVQVETSGSLSNPGVPWDKIIVVCSPKTSRLHPDMIHVDAWKYILQAGKVSEVDGLSNQSTQIPLAEKADRRVCRPMNKNQVYVSPVDDLHQKENTQQVVRSALKFGYRVSLQIHKILGVD